MERYDIKTSKHLSSIYLSIYRRGCLCVYTIYTYMKMHRVSVDIHKSVKYIHEKQAIRWVTHLTSNSVSLVNSRMSAAVPMKIRRSCESSSRVTPPPRGSNHFPTMRRMSRIWWRARIHSREQTADNAWLNFWKKKRNSELVLCWPLKGVFFFFVIDNRISHGTNTKLNKAQLFTAGKECS